MGKEKFPTPLGTYPVLAKDRTVTMDSSSVGIPVDDPEGYLLEVDNAVRISSRGLYVHAAPWAVRSWGWRTSATAASASAPPTRSGISTRCGSATRSWSTTSRARPEWG